jgi:hypothetical protein
MIATQSQRSSGIHIRESQSICCQNASWYDETGRFLGSGDLTFDAVKSMQSELRPGQAIYVVQANEETSAPHWISPSDLMARHVPFTITVQGYFLITDQKRFYHSDLALGPLTVKIAAPDELISLAD